MFLTFFKQEVMMGLRSPMVYIFMSVVGLLVFFAVVSDNVMIGGAVGDVHKNAPAVVGSFCEHHDHFWGAFCYGLLHLVPTHPY